MSLRYFVLSIFEWPFYTCFTVLGNDHKMGWPTVLIVGHRFQFPVAFLTLKIVFVLANSADPDEMPHYAAFHQDPHCLLKAKLIFRDFV